MICVIASITVKKEEMTSFLNVFTANVPTVLAEDGCLEYAPMTDVVTGMPIQNVNECVVTVVEKWESLDCLKTHLRAPHMLAYKEKVQDMVLTVSLKVLQPI